MVQVVPEGVKVQSDVCAVTLQHMRNRPQMTELSTARTLRIRHLPPCQP